MTAMAVHKVLGLAVAASAGMCEERCKCSSQKGGELLGRRNEGCV
jgi:hypothetical protein